ncbi:DUF4126 domain-containing protein [Leucobacter musarum]|uniref:DUF4126 domain-containing protein n=1 Tax=Leucobacter musarum TaxID=1930747 RepID=UPI0006A776E5|nr:DUF4126 domain-containing protein [Leucobacter musarum]
MLEILTGMTLAASAGLNAYIPLLGLGLLSRYTSIVQLPDGWVWLENGWSLGILGALLAIEILVDKIPALDSVNDVLHTIVRPASGGMVFAAGSGSDTWAVSDPSTLVQSGSIWPFVLGVTTALVPHLLKTIARPLINAMTAGAGAAVSSALEDFAAAALTVLAVIVPVLALVGVIAVCTLLIRRLRRALRDRRQRTAPATV